ncbi:MerR family transcriptional regulator [Oceanibaculum indicum]|uniref:MerR family transcriptional regulator n=1 Tax=Oceanibaculum indicum TaxID=526216 RepID=UPI0011C42B04|nr:hypothetical protein [Oceanibaculum indicum]
MSNADRYPIEAAITAALCTRSDVKNWNRRGLITSALEPVDHGKARGYSRLNIYELALLKVLSEAGVSLMEIPGSMKSIMENIESRRDLLLDGSTRQGTILIWTPTRPGFLTWQKANMSIGDAIAQSQDQIGSIPIVKHMAPAIVAIDLIALVKNVDSALAQWSESKRSTA